jgi:hypothetical protein
MTIQTSQTTHSQNNPLKKIVRQDQEGIELPDSLTPDSHEAYLIPAETLARMDREGDHFRHLAEDPAGEDSFEATRGFTVDREGLLDNYAIEPKMYYETPGDLPEGEGSKPE